MTVKDDVSLLNGALLEDSLLTAVQIYTPLLASVTEATDRVDTTLYTPLLLSCIGSLVLIVLVVVVVIG